MPLLKLAPSLFYMVFGLLAGQTLKISKESLARILIYILSPAVTLMGAWGAPLEGGNQYLPLVTFGLSSLLCVTMDRFFVWVKRPRRNLLAYAGGCCNSGYFGLPLAVAFLGEEAFSRAVLISMGYFFFENTVGFYHTARGHFSVRESFGRLFRLPYIYAFAAGLAFNALRVPRPALLSEDLLLQIRGAYSVLGMMLVGVGMGVAFRHIRQCFFDPFNVSVLVVKFLVTPLLVRGLISLDPGSQFFSPGAKQSLLLASLLPLAANTVAFATELNVAPEMAAFVVFESTLVSLALYNFVWPWWQLGMGTGS